MGDPRRLRRTGDCRTKMFRRDRRGMRSGREGTEVDVTWWEGGDVQSY
jgi:hypothetical protein